jgi:hypothetical protein
MLMRVSYRIPPPPLHSLPPSSHRPVSLHRVLVPCAQLFVFVIFKSWYVHVNAAALTYTKYTSIFTSRSILYFRDAYFNIEWLLPFELLQ